MDFSKYAVFLKVVEFGSMSKAASYCNYSQSAVSQIISSLEKDLQVTLLNRSQNGIWLTSAGEHILPYIKELSRAEESVYHESERLRGMESGHIKLGTFSSVSCHIMIPILKAFKTSYPNISIEIREGDNFAIESWLAQGTVDFGFIDSPTLAGFTEIPVCTDPFRAVMAKDSEYARLDIIPIEVFEKVPMILFDEGTKKEAAGILRRSKINPKVEYTSRDDSLILSMIENDLCMGFMGSLILTKTPYKVVAKPTEPAFFRDIVLTVKNRGAASTAARKFIEFFEEHLEKNRPQMQT